MIWAAAVDAFGGGRAALRSGFVVPLVLIAVLPNTLCDVLASRNWGAQGGKEAPPGSVHRFGMISDFIGPLP